MIQPRAKQVRSVDESNCKGPENFYDAETGRLFYNCRHNDREPIRSILLSMCGCKHGNPVVKKPAHPIHDVVTISRKVKDLPRLLKLLDPRATIATVTLLCCSLFLPSRSAALLGSLVHAAVAHLHTIPDKFFRALSTKYLV